MNNSGSSQYLHDDELDDEQMTDGSGLLGGQKQEQNSFEVPCCGWMSVRYYQPVRFMCQCCKSCCVSLRDLIKLIAWSSIVLVDVDECDSFD